MRLDLSRFIIRLRRTGKVGLQALRFLILPLLLQRYPRPIWRGPAMILATLRLLTQPINYFIAGPALRALGEPATPLSRLKFGWSLCYHREADLLLAMQADRLTPRWIADHIRRDNAMPTTNALIVAPHHAHHWLGVIALHNIIAPHPLAAVSLLMRDQDSDTPGGRWKQRQLYAPLVRLLQRTFETKLLLPENATRQALRLLQAGDSLAISLDMPAKKGRPIRVFGKAITFSAGALWLAQKTGRPLIPCMITPRGNAWHIWIGLPQAATSAGIGEAIEVCLRQNPATWPLWWWLQWHAAPAWDAVADGAAPGQRRGWQDSVPVAE
ncbi:MAG TPA: hypothetical protein VIL85_29650 [Thermomicrobiales bacterium]